MQTITQRKKLSKGTWALISIALIALIAVIILAVVGIIDLSFITADYDMATGTAGLLVGYALFGSSGWINALITIVLPFAAGAFVCFLAYRYFIGQKVTIANTASVYTPQTGASPTTTNSGTATEVG